MRTRKKWKVKMRRVGLLIITMTAALVVASGVALAAVIDCTGGLCPGTNNNDTMTGTVGFDDMRGRDGADRMDARAGNDRLTGGLGGDVLSGQGGSDLYLFASGWGQDRIPSDGEGAGIDTLDFSALTSPVTVRLIPSADNEAVSGANTLNFPETVVMENARGGASDDTIRGNSTNNGLFGNGGDDKIYGSSPISQGGTDYMYGGGGNDYMQANSDGSKTYYGEEGNDEISGNGYSETVYGGTGTDKVNTFGGDDFVDVADGDAGDIVDCHVGTNDTVEVDRRRTIRGFRVVDTHQNCENVIVRTSF